MGSLAPCRNDIHQARASCSIPRQPWEPERIAGGNPAGLPPDGRDASTIRRFCGSPGRVMKRPHGLAGRVMRGGAGGAVSNPGLNGASASGRIDMIYIMFDNDGGLETRSHLPRWIKFPCAAGMIRQRFLIPFPRNHTVSGDIAQSHQARADPPPYAGQIHGPAGWPCDTKSGLEPSPFCGIGEVS